jgi:hypothetical protein
MFSLRLSCISGYQRVAPSRYSVAMVMVVLAAAWRSRSSSAVWATACSDISVPAEAATTAAVNPYLAASLKNCRRSNDTGSQESLRFSMFFSMVSVLPMWIASVLGLARPGCALSASLASAASVRKIAEAKRTRNSVTRSSDKALDQPPGHGHASEKHIQCEEREARHESDQWRPVPFLHRFITAGPRQACRRARWRCSTMPPRDRVRATGG